MRRTWIRRVRGRKSLFQFFLNAAGARSWARTLLKGYWQAVP